MEMEIVLPRQVYLLAVVIMDGLALLALRLPSFLQPLLKEVRSFAVLALTICQEGTKTIKYLNKFMRKLGSQS